MNEWDTSERGALFEIGCEDYGKNRNEAAMKRKEDLGKGAKEAARERKKDHGKNTKEAAGKEKQGMLRLRVLRFLAKYAVLALLLLAGNRFFATVQVVHGEDMYPRLRDSDLLLVLRGKRARSSGDVIVYRKNGSSYTGRIAAGPADTVSVSGDGTLLVNGAPVWQDVFYPTYAPEGTGTYTEPLVLGENTYYVLADRRTQAQDSRTFGTIHESEITGTVLWVLRHRGI